jgi:MHS family alpha-ketoglutarate permease-like MFS transporter
MTVASVFVAAGVAVLPGGYVEMFPTGIGRVGLAVPYSMAVAVFGGTAPCLQTWTASMSGVPLSTATSSSSCWCLC